MTAYDTLMHYYITLLTTRGTPASHAADAAVLLLRAAQTAYIADDAPYGETMEGLLRWVMEQAESHTPTP